VKLVLFGDLHLEAPFTWLQGDRAAHAHRRQALRETLKNIVELAKAEQADALLCSGDLFEHERTSPDTGAFLKAIFAELHPMPVFIAPGNHDWSGPQSLYALTQWSPNVHVFKESRLEAHELEPGLTLWGAAHCAPMSTSNFLDGFSTGSHGADVHLALMHASESSWWQVAASEQQGYAAFRAEQISSAGLHHALLGHLHTPKDADSYTYPGNPDPLTFGEKGDRGAVIVSVSQNGEVQRERRQVSVSQVHDIEVDVSGCASREEIREKLHAGLSGMEGFVRASLCGEVAPAVEFTADDLRVLSPGVRHLTTRTDGLHVGYDFDSIAKESTVKGQFVCDVRGAEGLSQEERESVLITGLRALDGRSDLETP